MSIDFTQIVTTTVTTPTGINIALHEAAPSPPDPPIPPVPIPWTYPEIIADFIFGPTDVNAIMALLELPSPPGFDPLYPLALIVKLSAGTYHFPRTVRPKLQGGAAGITFVADHGATVIFDFNTAAGHGFLFTGLSAAKSVWFRRIRFTDARTGDTGQGGFNLVKFDNGSDIRFYECTFDNCRATAIYANAGAFNILFFGCVIRDNGVSTQLDHGCYMHSTTGTLRFLSCIFISNGSHALHFFDGGTSNLELIQNISVEDSTFLSYGEPQDRPVLFQDDSFAQETVRGNNVSGCFLFNAFPSTDPTEIDRNSVKFVRPVTCSFKNNVSWNVGLVAPIGVLKSNNQSVPPVGVARTGLINVLDAFADHYSVTIFNYALLANLTVDLTLPAGKYRVACATGGGPVSILTLAAGEDISFAMSPNYAVPQNRAGGFNYPSHIGANVFLLTRLPD